MRPRAAAEKRSVAELVTEQQRLAAQMITESQLPALLLAMEGLTRRPELVPVDGQGFDHPRRFGVACHLGVVTGLCTIGVGKSRLCGQFQAPGTSKSALSELLDGEEVIGKVWPAGAISLSKTNRRCAERSALRPSALRFLPDHPGVRRTASRRHRDRS